MPVKDSGLKSILDGCLKKRRNSQRKLYEHFYGYALNICLRYAGNREDAVEILNDSFLKVFSHLDRYDPEQAFKSWLRRIVVNTAIDHHRKNHRYNANTDLETVEMAEEESYPTLNPNEDILPLIQQLSPQYRTVFNLYVMEGYDHKEIAETLNITVNTSRSNLMRAKLRLKELLQQQYDQQKGSFEYGRFFRAG